MQGHLSEAEFLASVSGFLVAYYLAAALLNAGAVWYWWSRRARRQRPCRAYAGEWECAGVAAGRRRIPGPVADCLERSSALDAVAHAARVAARWVGSVAGTDGLHRRHRGDSVVSLCGPPVLHAAAVAWAGLNLSLLAMGLSLTDPDFAAIVAKPDNVPIVGLIFLLGFFTWLSGRKAVLNDQRLAQGLPPCGSGGQREGTGVARPGLYRTDLHGGADGACCWSGPFC